jgi:2-isopropylmalate synthase
VEGVRRTVLGSGNGPIDAFVTALRHDCGLDLSFLDYHRDAIGHGSNVEAVCFVRKSDGKGRERFFTGIHQSTVTASRRAIVSGVNRLLGKS